MTDPMGTDMAGQWAEPPASYSTFKTIENPFNRMSATGYSIDKWGPPGSFGKMDLTVALTSQSGEGAQLKEYGTWRDAADSRRNESLSRTQQTHIEHGTELGQRNDNSKNYVATPVHPGNGVQHVKYGIGKEGYYLTFSPNAANVPKGYHMIGFAWAHRYRDPSMFHYDATRASNARMNAAGSLSPRPGDRY